MLLAFVAMSAAIAYNAVYLQTGPHPSPMTNDRLASPGRSDKLPTATPGTSRELSPPALTTASLPRSQTIEAVQRRLVENGYEPGPVDGVQGQMTMAAIMAYQHDHDLPVTGLASSQLLKNMILGGSVGGSSGSELVSPPEEMTLLVRMIQKTLADLDYKPGPIDGLLGNATRSAIKKFERDRKLTVSGRISGQLLQELRKANGGRLSQLASS